MQYFSDEQLDDMFRFLDFDQLEQLGYKMDIYSPDQLEDFLITIEEEFSELDREDKIAELRQIGAFDDDYLVHEVKMSAETDSDGNWTNNWKGNFIEDLQQRGREAYMKLSPEEKKEWKYKWKYSGRPKGQRTRFTDLLEPITTTRGWANKDAETKRQRMKREKAEREMDEAATDVDYMREHYSESDAYIYAYNDGHRDGRSNTVSYQPSASDRELTSFKKIFKQAEFAADSPFNTLLMIREDIIIDDEEDFDRLLSIYMSLESDIAQLYQETDNPKHPLLAEMMRYRNRIANRLDELQEEVAIQDTIEMDAENRRVFADPTVPIQLQQPLRTGYKLGLGWVAAALTIPLALLGLGAFYNQE